MASADQWEADASLCITFLVNFYTNLYTLLKILSSDEPDALSEVSSTVIILIYPTF